MLRPPGMNVSRTGSLISSLLQSLVSGVRYILTICLLCCCVLICNLLFDTTQDQSHLHPIESYGYLWSFLLYMLRGIPYLSLPFAITNILGIVMMGAFPPPPKLVMNQTSFPFLCFRVVTKGLYPDLVETNVKRNVQTCYNVGLEDFEFVVVTDNQINMQKSTKVREIVVPSKYSTENNSLFKARALQYCNEHITENLSSGDWVVHLDEETLLTESSAIGLVNFASRGVSDVGQGVITYANEEIVNWLTTLADSIRVSIDLGMMRFSFRKLGCPFMGFKGSFIIARGAVEKDVGFDFGPKGSVAEDIMFALTAWSKGYTFGFVDGEMWEKSPFTLADYIKQRKRWFIGHMNALLSDKIPLRCKLGMIPTDLGWLLLFGNMLNVPFSMAFPIPLPMVFNVVAGSLPGVVVFMFMLGAIKSFSLRRYGLLKMIFILIANVCFIPVTACLDAVASVYGFWTRNSGGFHIVEKENGPYVIQENTNNNTVNYTREDVV